MKHIKKTYQKFNGDYVLENVETFNNSQEYYFIESDFYTNFNGGYIVTTYNKDKMIKDIFLT